MLEGSPPCHEHGVASLDDRGGRIVQPFFRPRDPLDHRIRAKPCPFLFTRQVVNGKKSAVYGITHHRPTPPLGGAPLNPGMRQRLGHGHDLKGVVGLVKELHNIHALDQAKQPLFPEPRRLCLDAHQEHPHRVVFHRLDLVGPECHVVDAAQAATKGIRLPRPLFGPRLVFLGHSPAFERPPGHCCALGDHLGLERPPLLARPRPPPVLDCLNACQALAIGHQQPGHCIRDRQVRADPPLLDGALQLAKRGDGFASPTTGFGGRGPLGKDQLGLQFTHLAPKPNQAHAAPLQLFFEPCRFPTRFRPRGFFRRNRDFLFSQPQGAPLDHFIQQRLGLPTVFRFAAFQHPLALRQHVRDARFLHQVLSRFTRGFRDALALRRVQSVLVDLIAHESRSPHQGHG